MSRKNRLEEKTNVHLFLPKERQRVAPNQSNHEGYMLPTCLANLPPMPFYLAVAHFGLMTRQLLSREVICRAFHIDTRRALEVMRYLVNSAPRVTCERVSLMQARGYCLRILDIAQLEATVDSSEPAPPPPTTVELPSRSATDRALQRQQMRQWFLRRPNP